MTPSEFKAWFGGFTEALEGTPSEEQWKRIKARVAEIDGRPITEHVYVHRYLPSYYYGTPYWQAPYVYCGTGGATGPNSGVTVNGSNALLTNGNNAASFDSHAAMLSLGRAEAQGMN